MNEPETRQGAHRRRAARLVLCATLLGAGSCGRTPGDVSSLAGVWRLNLDETRYGAGVDPRSDETFDCRVTSDMLSCSITSIRLSGDTLHARFDAPRDGAAGTVRGIAGVDRARLVRATSDGVHAVFGRGDVDVLGYVVSHPEAGDVLVVRTTDPATGESLGTTVVYDRVE